MGEGRERVRREIGKRKKKEKKKKKKGKRKEKFRCCINLDPK